MSWERRKKKHWFSTPLQAYTHIQTTLHHSQYHIIIKFLSKACLKILIAKNFCRHVSSWFTNWYRHWVRLMGKSTKWTEMAHGGGQTIQWDILRDLMCIVIKQKESFKKRRKRTVEKREAPTWLETLDCCAPTRQSLPPRGKLQEFTKVPFIWAVHFWSNGQQINPACHHLRVAASFQLWQGR